MDSNINKITKNNTKNSFYIFSFISKYKVKFIFGCVCLFFSSTIVLAFPYTVGKLIDVATGKLNGNLFTIEKITIYLFAILIVQALFSFLRVYLFSIVSENAIADIRIKLYQKTLHLSNSFYDKNRVGELMSRISSDVSQLQDSLSTTLAEFFRQICVLIVGTTLIFYNSPKLSIFMFATFPVLVVVAIVFGRFIKKMSKNTQQKLADTNIIVEETLQAINVVKVFTNQLFEVNRYKKSINEVVETAIKTSIYRGAFISFIIFALFGGIVLVLWYGASLVSSGEMTTGDLTSFVIYTTFIGASVGGLGELYGQIQKSMGAANRVVEILEEAEEVNSGDVEFKNDNIYFENIYFQYPTREEQIVLDNISFNIQKGKQTAIVGESGSGKSTLAQLLMRFYNLEKGNIKIGNTEISDFELSSYRGSIAYVPQDVMLFGGSIRENIMYGNLQASEEEMIAAAKNAFAYDFIQNLPEKFETIVGERGTKLSGGQRQRIAIARAMLKNAPILILDEATSALDNNSEHQIQQALHNLMLDKTAIVIAHRLSTIQNADKIIVLSKGKIVEQGSHFELINIEDGYYSKMYNNQSIGVATEHSILH